MNKTLNSTKSQAQIYSFSLINLNRKNQQTPPIKRHYRIIRWHLDVNLPDSNVLKLQQAKLRRTGHNGCTA